MLLTGLAMSPGIDAALPCAARRVRRPAVGAHDPFHLAPALHRALRRRAPRHGAGLGRLEQHPLDDHRPLRDRAGGGTKRMSADRSSTAAASCARRWPRPALVLLGGCDELVRRSPGSARILRSAETLTTRAQRACSSPQGAGARIHRGRHLAGLQGQRHDRPDDDGLRGACRRTASPTGGWRSTAWSSSRSSLSLADLRAMPSRTQITRHDCVEGWSCIGKWTGVPLGAAARQAGLKPDARYIVFHCADELGADRSTARPVLREHRPRSTPSTRRPSSPTSMNGQALPVAARRAAAPARRAPARLQAGQVRDADRGGGRDSPAFGRGNGGFWEDRGYEWYAGI